MSQGHANNIVLMGDIDGFHHASDGRITGVILRVDIGQVAFIPVLPETPIAGLHKGDRIWLRGELRSLRCAGQRYAMIYIAPRHFDVVKRRSSR